MRYLFTEKCRHYFNHWSEIRFIRHEAMEPWKGVQGWPEQITDRVRSYHRRIRCRHFPYRSPAQIERRIATRASCALSGTAFNYEALKNWRTMVDPLAIQQHRWKGVQYVTEPIQMERGWESRVIEASHLVFDAHDGRFILNEHLMRPIPNVHQTFLQRLVSNRFTRPILQRLKKRMTRSAHSSVSRSYPWPNSLNKGVIGYGAASGGFAALIPITPVLSFVGMILSLVAMLISILE